MNIAIERRHEDPGIMFAPAGSQYPHHGGRDAPRGR